MLGVSLALPTSHLHALPEACQGPLMVSLYVHIIKEILLLICVRICRSIHNKEILDTCSDDFMYLSCVRFVKQVGAPLSLSCLNIYPKAAGMPRSAYVARL